MKKVISIIVFVLIACMVAPAALAAYPAHDSYIYDEIGVLSDEAKSEIKNENDVLFVDKGMRVGVCIVDNTGDIPAETYANGVYEEWKLNGVLLLIVKSTNYAYAAPSEALEGILTADKIQSLIGNIKSPDNAEEFSAEVAASVKNISSFIEANYKEQQTGKKSTSALGKVWKVIKTLLVIALVVAIILGIGYVVLIVLERRQARQRREYLEERRRRMAQSGRGAYYSAGSGDPRRQGARPAGNGYPSGQGYPRQNYGQQNGYQRQNGYAQQNAVQTRNAAQGARGDRFVYPDSGDGYSAANRGQNVSSARGGQNVRRPATRGSTSDFDREYFSRPDPNYDNYATREFKTDNNNNN